MSAFARAAELRREGGLRRVAVGGLAVTVYRRLAVLERSTESVPEPDMGSLESRFLDGSDLDAYEGLRTGQREVAAARLAAGDRCFGSWLGGSLVAARWQSTGAPRSEYLDMRIPLAEDESYGYDSFVDPARRGLGIATATQLQLLPLLAELGVRRNVRTILPENPAALREAAKVGYVVTGKIGYVRLGPWRHEFVRRHSSCSTA